MVRVRARPTSPAVRRIVPDGRIDILFQLGDLAAGHPAGVGRSFVVGAMPVFADVVYEGLADVVGVRFRAGGASALLDPPMSELTGRLVDLGALWTGVASLEDQVATAASPEARRRVLEAGLTARLRRDLRADPLAEHLEDSGGRVSVAELARLAGIGERQLERRFRERVGFSPRMTRRIARFWSAAKALRRSPSSSAARLAQRCGFFDQAHMIREFRAFAGVTPRRWAADDVGFIQDSGGDVEQIDSGAPAGGATVEPARRGRPSRQIAGRMHAEN
jgi:AraC-like DNA-binding protein